MNTRKDCTQILWKSHQFWCFILCLLWTIQCLLQLIDFVFMAFLYASRRLLNVHFFFKVAIQEGWIHIHLVDLLLVLCYYAMMNKMLWFFTSDTRLLASCNHLRLVLLYTSRSCHFYLSSSYTPIWLQCVTPLCCLNLVIHGLTPSVFLELPYG